ncbi:MAG: OmpA family protein [Bernardetiaceae bacterium]|jgi:OOP family OmpA-OmpF porin|nr:OmpA family protein [Bernardetiaceae bacterium]
MNLWTLFWSACIVGWTALGSYWYTCKYQQLCDGGSRQVYVPDPGPPPFSSTGPFTVQRLGQAFINAPEDLVFTTSAGSVDLPTASAFALDSLRAYLTANPNARLDLVGYYHPRETNSTTFANLGLARADAFAKLLFPNGSTQVRTRAEARSSLPIAQPKFNGGLMSSLTEVNPDAGKTEFSEAEEKVLQSSQMVYFQTGGSKIIETEEQKKYFALLKDYLKAYPNSNIILTGHTDNQGKPEANLLLGQKRADEVKRQLVAQLGLSPSQVNTSSQGDTKPVADNATAEGRNLNRRVQITFVKQ